MKKVLIFEPHPYHYEVVIGVSYYFYELGYEIELLVRENFDKEDLYCQSLIKSNIRVNYYKESEMKVVLSSNKIKGFDFVFFSSLEFFGNGYKGRLLDFLGFYPDSKYGVLGIYHNLDIVSDSDIEMLEKGRIFSLTPFEYKGYHSRLLSPSYFGEISMKETREGFPEIVLVGGSNKRVLFENAIGQAKVKHTGKFRAGVIGVESIKYYIARVLVKNIIADFSKLWNSNSKIQRRSILGALALHFYGKVTFKEMYSHISNASYIGIIMDPTDEVFKDFLYGKTSGAKQLALAFGKPCIINRKFAEAFGFHDGCCIIYEENNVIDGIYRAVSITNEEYRQMVKNMDRLRKQMIKNSHDNLLDTINGAIYAAN